MLITKTVLASALVWQMAVGASLAKAPVDGEVCFAPVEACGDKLEAFLQSAGKSIDMAIYDVNLDPLVQLLLAKSKTIPVRVVVDKRQSKGSHSLVSLLVKGGVKARYGHQRGIMHNKFTIVDGAMVETGSFNYTNHATRANNENQVYLASSSTVDRFIERFAEIWDDAEPIPRRKKAGAAQGD